MHKCYEEQACHTKPAPTTPELFFKAGRAQKKASVRKQAGVATEALFNANSMKNNL